MNCDNLFETIDRLSAEYIGFWRDICNIESPTEFKSGVDRVGDHIIKKARSLGFEVEKMPLEMSGDPVCITCNGDPSCAPVVFSGHIDTVFPLGTFGTPAVRTEGNRMFGPGVTDCKGGVAAALLAMAALSECGFSRRPVKLILQTDEETGSEDSKKATVRFMCEKATGAVAFLNCEEYNPGFVTSERKGILRYTFNVRGKAVHAAACYDGASAIREAAYKLIELEKYKDKDGITISCGRISGGASVNTVPESCSFSIDVRFSTAEEAAVAEQIVKNIAAKQYIDGTFAELVCDSRRVAMEPTAENAALISELNRIFDEVGLTVLKPAKRNGGSDAADITSFGIPCVDSLGVTGGAIHTLHEYALIPSLAESAKRLAAIAYCI